MSKQDETRDQKPEGYAPEPSQASLSGRLSD